MYKLQFSTESDYISVVYLVVRSLDLRLNGREFDPRPPHYRSVGTGMDVFFSDRLRADVPFQYVTSHPGLLSLLPSVGREMSTGQNALMSCGWEVKVYSIRG